MRFVSSFLTVLLSLSFCLLSTDAYSQSVWSDPDRAAKEHPDFRVQGEYRGAVRSNQNETSVGAQVIARGKGSFRLVLYPGGLPGAGWNGRDRYQMTSERNNDHVRFEVDESLPFSVARLGDQVIRLNDANGTTLGRLKKITRKSDTLGLKPPENAVVLFDGTEQSLEEHWQQGATMTEDGLLIQGATSTDKFQDARVHLEFRLPFKPEARGQGRGNSGFYMQGRYEIQMLDSFGLKPAHNRCGGIYEVRPPDVNMTFPPLTWQTYDLEFQAPEFKNGEKTKPARMTVLHNGILIHEDVPVKKPTRAAPVDESPDPGPLYLQDHGNPVRYRHIWVAPLNQ